MVECEEELIGGRKGDEVVLTDRGDFQGVRVL